MIAWYARNGWNEKNAGAPEAVALADRHALLTILRNLLRNAAEHASALQEAVAGLQDRFPGIEARADGARSVHWEHTVAVTDHGPEVLTRH